MALNKEVWVNQIKENFYPDYSFLKSFSDYSEYVDNNKIHIPGTGIDPNVLINNNTYPIAVSGREDEDNVISLDKFETENTIVRRPDAIEYSYDKLESVISQHRATLQKSTSMKAAHAIAPMADTAKTPVIMTTGAADATGRLPLTLNDILLIKERFDEAQIPPNDRFIILHPKHVTDLLREDIKLFKDITDLTKGEPMRFAGFGMYSFGFTPTYNTVEGVITKEAFDLEEKSNMFASVAFFRGEVMKADGDIYMYSNEDDPKERGTIVGFDKRFVAIPIRGLGVGAIVSAYTPEG